ncbi:hypothetical protein [Microbulbifer taiwanensis]|uniref:Lipoprotein n=1 Tax=Microbulbifer taiwanensis TaxID=986746 RepID=A0ABW1YQ26_9GAMM|nr:hypothetical protein [Microbulbifer taiwanensis]
MRVGSNLAAAIALQWRRGLAMTLSMLAVACASERPLPIPGLKESFHTEVSANGAKRFTYSLEMQRRDIPRPYTADGSGNRRIGRDVVVATNRSSLQGRRDNLQFDRAMEQKLMESGFCRRGYFELERSVSAFSGEVRGECREGAQ